MWLLLHKKKTTNKMQNFCIIYTISFYVCIYSKVIIYSILFYFLFFQKFTQLCLETHPPDCTEQKENKKCLFSGALPCDLI